MAAPDHQNTGRCERERGARYSITGARRLWLAVAVVELLYVLAVVVAVPIGRGAVLLAIALALILAAMVGARLGTTRSLAVCSHGDEQTQPSTEDHGRGPARAAQMPSSTFGSLRAAEGSDYPRPSHDGALAGRAPVDAAQRAPRPGARAGWQ
jgi:hypothetical protein